MSLRLKLFLAFGTIVFLTIAGVVLVARQSTVREVRAFMVQGGMTGTGNLVDLLESYFQTYGSWAGVEKLLVADESHGMGAGMAGMMRQRLILADANKTILVDTANSIADRRLSRQESSQAIRLQVDGNTVGYLVPLGGVGAGQNAERYLITRLNRAALFTGLIVGGIALLLAALLSYQLLRPVGELTRAAEILAKGDLSQRVPVRGQDELSRLAMTFNHMADSLQQAEEMRRAMTADIAHELRNPLAVQRANLEALQDGVYPLTPANLQPVLEQNLLLSHLVDDLRTLALAESGQLKMEFTPTDLPDLAQRVVDRFEPQANANHITVQISLDIDPQNPLPLLNVDPMRIEQILNNLLSNALRYTPQGGQIMMAISQTRQNVLLTVHDSGTGIPTDALPHIFERFYRIDRSRSRSEGGSGLGLAIARELAEAQSGTLTASNHPKGGAVFTLTLPLPDKRTSS